VVLCCAALALWIKSRHEKWEWIPTVYSVIFIAAME